MFWSVGKDSASALKQLNEKLIFEFLKLGY